MNPFQGVLLDLWSDLREPVILWQVGAVAACMALAWVIARSFRVSAGADDSRARKLGAGGLNRIVFPLLAMLLLLGARAVLGRMMNVHLLSVAIPLFASLAGVRFVVYLLRLAFAPGGALAASERVVATLIWAAFALHLTGLLPEIEAILEDVRFTVGKSRFTLLAALQGVFWILLTLLAALWAGSVLEARLLRAKALHSSLRVVLARLGKAVLLVIAVLVVLPVVGLDLTVLSVFGGALGVGLGLGLQKIASNYVSGFIVLLDRSIRIGDWITADNHYGEVRQITTRYTVVRSLSGVEAIIPNDALITSTVLNHTYGDKQLRLVLKVCVAYSTDLPPVIALLKEIALRHPRVLREPEPVAMVTNLGESGVDVELGYWIEDPEKGRASVGSDLSLAVLAEFRARGIEIPFPQREVRLLDRGPA